MKAKEYIAKYRADFESEDEAVVDKAIFNFLMEISEEGTEIAKARGAKRDSAVIAILKEQNTKWNAVANAFPNLLIRNGFREYWRHEMPEIEKAWR